MAHPRSGLTSLFLVTAGFCCAFHSTTAMADSVRLVACANHEALKAYPEHNILSAVEGPRGLLVELAAGDWGKDLGPGRVLNIDCSARQSEALEIAGAAEISDPWYDRESGRLFFVSRGPGPAGPKSDRDIFVSHFSDGAWSDAERLDAPVNLDSDEYSPVLRGNKLYFASAREGQGDLYVIDLETESATPQRLPPALNSHGGEWNLWVSENEAVVIFEASSRAANQSASGDLYLSARDRKGRWRPAVPLARLNRKGSELNARVIGQDLLFARQSPDSRRVLLRSEHYPTVLAKATAAFDLQLIVANRSSHSLSALNLLHGDESARLETGKGPHLIALSPSGRRLAAAAYGVFPKPHKDPVPSNPGWQEEGGGEAAVWNLLTGEADYIQSSCRRPHGSAWQDDHRLWLSCEDRNGLIAIDLASESPAINFLPTDYAGAHVLAWDAGHSQMLAAHTEAGGLWFQPTDGGAGEFLELGAGSEAIQILPGGDQALVSLGPGGKVAVVNLASRSLHATLDPGCSFPIDFAVDALERVWVACMFSRELLRIDPGSGAVGERIELSSGPLNIVVHPDQLVLYASTPRLNQVQEIALDSGQVTRFFEVGIEPDGLALVGFQD
jgi:DNA-binding beta-propeller fold protein YncE